MRAEVEWTNPAFVKLEALPEHLAFEVVRRVDLLAAFPEMGLSIRTNYPELHNCRQLILSNSYRVIYEFKPAKSTVYVLDVQHCRRRLPSAAELKHRIRQENQ
jgi:mRNA-degrading endonuclease RelE of RelBE toxin-antitoxin system